MDYSIYDRFRDYTCVARSFVYMWRFTFEIHWHNRTTKVMNKSLSNDQASNSRIHRLRSCSIYCSISVTLFYLFSFLIYSRSTMLKLTYLIKQWHMIIEMMPLSSFHGETIYPEILAGHDIVLFSLMKNSS
jgi:hypothetical protein